MTPDRPYERALSAFDDLNPDTPLAEWEQALQAYDHGPTLRPLRDGAAYVTGWQALRDMVRVDVPSVQYITDNCPAEDHRAAHIGLTHFGASEAPPGGRLRRKIRTSAAVARTTHGQGTALSATVDHAFDRLAAATGPVDLQMGFAIPLALSAIAVLHGFEADQHDLSAELYPSISKMRYLFDFLHHDRAMEEAPQICVGLIEAMDTIARAHQDVPPPGGIYCALRNAGDAAPHAVMAGLNLAGVSPIADGIRWMMWKTATDPVYRAALMRRGGTRAFALNHIRLFPQQMAYRELPRGGEVAGQSLPPGTKLFANLPAALRDPRAMTAPLSFEADNAPFARLAFGGSSRRCAGSSYAVQLIHLAAARAASLADRIRVEPSGPAPTIGQFRNLSPGLMALSLAA